MNRIFNLWARALVLVSFLGFAGIVHAAPKTARADKPLKGIVVSVASDNTSVVVNIGKKKNTKEVTIAVDDNTTYTLDGNAAKITDLKAGQRVRVSPPTGTAKTITAKTPKKKGRHAGGSNGGGGN